MLVVEEIEDQNMKKENKIYVCIYSINRHNINVLDYELYYN